MDDLEITVRRFEQDGQTYVYDPSKLTAVQCEMAYEVCYFKQKQIEKQPDRFEHVVISGGADYRFRALSYLFVPEKDGIAQKFDIDKVTKTMNFLKSLQGVDIYSELREVLQHFLSLTNGSDLASQLHSRESLSLGDLFKSIAENADKLSPGSSQNTKASTRPVS